MLIVPHLNTIVEEPIKVTAIFSRKYDHNIYIHSFEWRGKTYKISKMLSVLRFHPKNANWAVHNPMYPDHTFFTVFSLPDCNFFQLRCKNDLTDWHLHLME